MSDKFVFSTTRDEFPVEIDGKDHILYEATGHANSVFRDQLMRGATILGGEGGQKLGKEAKIAEAELQLLSSCLKDEKDKNVRLDVIKAWPNSMVEKLVKKLREISGIDDEAEEDAGKKSGKPKKAGTS